MRPYLNDNLFSGLQRLPRQGLVFSAFAYFIFVLLGITLGLSSGFFTFSPAKYDNAYYLLLTMIIFPSLLEEAFFRGILIPQSIDLRDKKAIVYSLSSTALFVAWHPFNAYFFNHSAQVYFFDIRFLSIVLLLGLVCSLTYIASKSLLVPIFIHWSTIVSWVFVFGGHSMVGEALAIE